MKIKNFRSDIALNEEVREGRRNLLENLTIDLTDKSIELRASLGGANCNKMEISPKSGVANYIQPFELPNGYKLDTSEDKDIQFKLVGKSEEYIFYRNSSCFRKHGMEQEDYYNSLKKEGRLK